MRTMFPIGVRFLALLGLLFLFSCAESRPAASATAAAMSSTDGGVQALTGCSGLPPCGGYTCIGYQKCDCGVNTAGVCEPLAGCYNSPDCP